MENNKVLLLQCKCGRAHTHHTKGKLSCPVCKNESIEEFVIVTDRPIFRVFMVVLNRLGRRIPYFFTASSRQGDFRRARLVYETFDWEVARSMVVEDLEVAL